jgi:integrase/recombinase XerD
MPRKGQRLKVRKRWLTKPPGMARRAQPDPLADNGLLPYMAAHFEAMLVTGRSAYTIHRSRVTLRRFIAWCDERGLKHPADVTKPVLERYQRHLFYYRKADGKPLTLGTQAVCLATIKLWFKWLARENHILYNPASELELPCKSRKLPRVILSIAEVEAILAQADVAAPAGVRDRALLELLYSSGLRRMEAARLAIYDIDFDRRLVMVREGKGKRDRIIPVGARALAWLDKYLLEARPQLLTVEHEALFVTDYGEAAAPEFVAGCVRKYMHFAGVNKPGATHLLRHAMATHMLEGGADIRFLQAMLGHASLDTTEIYTHVAIEKLQAIHAATHPAKLHRTPESGAESGAAATIQPHDAARAALLDALEADTSA